MPSLRKTPFTGQVTWLGVVRDSSTDIRANPVDCLTLTFAGQEGECHAGLTRPACVRVQNMYPKNTPIKNVRQLTILSSEEIDSIASKLGTKSLDPKSMGASMVVQGIPDFSHLPPNSRLVMENGTAVTVDMENRPCMYTGQAIHQDNPVIGHWNKFKPAAKGLRGVTAWVEREGIIKVGDRVELFVPDQRPWHHLDELEEFDMNKEKGIYNYATKRTIRMIYAMILGMIFAIVITFV